MEHSVCVKQLNYIVSFKPDENSEKLLYRWGNGALELLLQVTLNSWTRAQIYVLLTLSHSGWRGCPVILVNNLNEKKANWLSLTLNHSLSLSARLEDGIVIKYFWPAISCHLWKNDTPKSLIIVSLGTKTKPLLNFGMSAVRSLYSAP